MKLFNFLLFSFTLMVASSSFAQKKVIVIDPGHGGNDSGTLRTLEGKQVREKDVVLAIAKKLQKEIFEKYKVYLTRTSDKYLSLKARSNFAQTVKADLFISIHINSSESKEYSGFETYYLDNRGDKALTKLEEEENQEHNWGDIEKIMMDIVIHKNADRSKDMSQIIHKEIAKNIKGDDIRDRGVKSGLFYVLALSKVPGLLLEVGFLSNDKEASKMLKSDFQNRYVQGLAEGINKIFEKY